MSGLILPVEGYTGISSWQAHQERGTPSKEPGTDFYVPIGTPIVAPADGYIYGSGNSIAPDTGRWVGINFDNGMSFRTMHHSQNLLTSGRVEQGRVFALSGASGYGEEDWSWNVAETGGAHVHATLWPTHDHLYGYRKGGIPFTIDLMQHASPRTIDLLGDPMSLRIIDGPFYRAAGYRVIHNGQAATSVPAGWVQDMITRGHIPYAAYDDDNLLTTEVNLVWQLGGLSTDAAAAKTAEMIKALG
ncbi:M23 family metallopeptidase [Microbacterium sp. A204]|uniref:M23 family metallopeptidase n=1 Tax=Microbacterium sp. A204 TaxID=3457321 RepID=UPI003FD3838C